MAISLIPVCETVGFVVAIGKDILATHVLPKLPWGHEDLLWDERYIDLVVERVRFGVSDWRGGILRVMLAKSVVKLPFSQSFVLCTALCKR